MENQYSLKPLYESERGYVLVTTILLMVLMTGLVLSSMQTVLLYAKVSARFFKKHEAFYQLESLAHQLLHQHQSGITLSCTMVHTNPNDIIQNLSDNLGCKRVWCSQIYRYYLETLGVYPEYRAAEEVLMSRHWRLTVMNEACDSLQLRVSDHGSPGKRDIISWRYLTGAEARTLFPRRNSSIPE